MGHGTPGIRGARVQESRRQCQAKQVDIGCAKADVRSVGTRLVADGSIRRSQWINRRLMKPVGRPSSWFSRAVNPAQRTWPGWFRRRASPWGIRQHRFGRWWTEREIGDKG